VFKSKLAAIMSKEQYADQKENMGFAEGVFSKSLILCARIMHADYAWGVPSIAKNHPEILQGRGRVTLLCWAISV